MTSTEQEQLIEMFKKANEAHPITEWVKKNVDNYSEDLDTIVLPFNKDITDGHYGKWHVVTSKYTDKVIVFSSVKSLGTGMYTLGVRDIEWQNPKQ